MPTSGTQLAHAAVIYNPVKVPLDRIRAAVDAYQAQHGWGETKWYRTSREDSGYRAAGEALAAQPAVIIIAGGDGTIRAATEVLYGTETPVALVPSGTGNLLARNLALPLTDIDALVRAAFEGQTRPIDVAVAELEDVAGHRMTHVFVVMAGIGLDAQMAKETSSLAKRRFGWLAYVMPIARSILVHRLFNMEYRVDGGRIRSTRAHTVIAGNCGTLTGNMLLLPAAQVDDGLLDLVMLRPKGRWGWARIGTRLTFQGVARHSRFGRSMLQLAPDLQTLAYAQGSSFEISFDTPRDVQLDGDSFGSVLRARISVRPGALRICIEGERA